MVFSGGRRPWTRRLHGTDPLAEAVVHGTNPQNIIEKKTWLKIYNSTFWKEHCFGLMAEDNY